MRVAVVGGGVLGASAAWHLARAGASVAIVDPFLDGRATAAGAGIVCPWSSAVTDGDYNRLAFAAARAYPGLVEALAADGDGNVGFRRVGGINVPADGLDALEALVRARVAGRPEAGTVSRLSPAEARALFPPLRDGQAALHVSGGARVDGRALSRALLAGAARCGATLHREAATGLRVAGGRVRGMALAGGTIDADAVLVAGGAWADALLRPVGVALGVVPQRGQIVHLLLPGADTGGWPVVLPMTGHYLLSFDGGRVVIGATRETGSGFDHRVTASGLTEVLAAGLSVAPGLANATVLETRIGFRPAGPDGRPVLGRAGAGRADARAVLRAGAGRHDARTGGGRRAGALRAHRTRRGLTTRAERPQAAPNRHAGRAVPHVCACNGARMPST